MRSIALFRSKSVVTFETLNMVKVASTSINFVKGDKRTQFGRTNVVSHMYNRESVSAHRFFNHHKHASDLHRSYDKSSMLEEK